MRNNYTRWKILQWIVSGRLRLPAGMTIADLEWEWVPRGMPWWDPAKEIKGDLMAVGAGFDNPMRITKRTGNGDALDNWRETCRFMAEARKISEEELGDPNAMVPSFAAKPEPVKGPERDESDSGESDPDEAEEEAEADEAGSEGGDE